MKKKISPVTKQRKEILRKIKLASLYSLNLIQLLFTERFLGSEKRDSQHPCGEWAKKETSLFDLKKVNPIIIFHSFHASLMHRA